MMKQDIISRQDIATLIDRFYTKVRKDELLAPVFLHVDWEHHTPVIINFWESLLFGSQTYQGNPFNKHINLPVKPQHFDRWLELFTQTLEENFSGEKANEAHERAHSIAAMFQYKMGLRK